MDCAHVCSMAYRNVGFIWVWTLRRCGILPCRKPCVGMYMLEFGGLAVNGQCRQGSKHAPFVWGVAVSSTAFWASTPAGCRRIHSP